MKVLYVVPHVPNPTKTRSYNHLIGLQQAGCTVTVAAILRNQNDREHARTLESSGIRVLAAALNRSQIARNTAVELIRNEPLQARLFWFPQLAQQIEAVAHGFDVIHVEHLRMALYGLHLKDRYPVVWDAVDSLTLLYEQARWLSVSRFWRLIAAVELPRIRRFERWLTGQFPATLVISAYDMEHFRRDNPFAERIITVPQGLPFTALDRQVRAERVLVMTGVLDYHPNVASALLLVQHIMPLVLRQHPDVRLQLVGARPVAAVRALSSPSVEITGFVPDIRSYLHRATLALAPTVYGAGIQNKVLDAFITETPLVATSTAARGFDIVNGEHAIIASAPQEFANAINTLLSDSVYRQHLGESGRRYLERHLRVEDTTDQLLAVYRDVINARRG